MTLAQIPEIGFFVQNSRIGVKMHFLYLSPFISNLAPSRAMFARPDALYPKSSMAQNHLHVSLIHKWVVGHVKPGVLYQRYGPYRMGDISFPFQPITVVSPLWEMMSHWWLLCQSERPWKILDELIQPWIHNPFENHRICIFTNRLCKIAMKTYICLPLIILAWPVHQFNGTHVFILKWMIMNFI